ncbi:MAG: Fe-S cluster assembly protein SufD [Bacteroidales bacterium]|nr:Fe-S cluster assembly protein SufD [Bacteroidales bacterium]
MDIKKKYIDIFESCAEQFRKSDTDFVFAKRNEAFEAFKSNGLPSAKTENYRNLNVNDIFSTEFGSIMQTKTNIDLNEYFKCEVENMDADVILLSNGKYYDNNKAVDGKIIICSMKEAQQKHREIFEKYYNRSASTFGDGFVNLSTMLADDGLFVYVPKNTHAEKTLQIINLTHGFGNKNIIKRNLIVLDENSSLSVVVCDHTLNSSSNFVIDTTESFVGNGSKLTHYTLQNEPDKSSLVSSHLAEIGENANVESFVLTLHGGIVRNNLRVRLNGEHSDANLLGLYLIDRQQYVDNYTLIEHLVPNCNSNELYKGILDEQARGSFMGKIIVHEGAQKTAAYQTNRNLCLTGDARMTTKPQLEIYADDVQCSHGATVGQLDEDSLFYLRQRGISTKEAKLMLMFAFANDILMNMHIEPLKERISNMINSRLRGELSECSNCLLNCEGGNCKA